MEPSTLAFKEHYVNLKDIKISRTKDFNKKFGESNRNNLTAGLSVEFHGRSYTPSERFWRSFCSKVGVNTNIFNLFDHDEVITRTYERNKFAFSGNVRIVEDKTKKQLLAMTSPTRPVLNWENVLSLIKKKNGEQINYNNGIITSVHPIKDGNSLLIGNERFNPKIAVDIPIDGYGSPSIYLSLMRIICSNGLIARAKTFKSSVRIGKKEKSNDIEFSLERMFDSFSNPEGFDALVERLDIARSSLLSLREYEQARKILAKIKNTQNRKFSKELEMFSSVAGDLHTKYGLNHIDQLSNRQLSLLGTNITIYEAINFLTEVSTHRLNPEIQNHLKVKTEIHGWIGDLISKPYDLENILDKDEVKSSFRGRYFN